MPALGRSVLSFVSPGLEHLGCKARAGILSKAQGWRIPSGKLRSSADEGEGSSIYSLVWGLGLDMPLKPFKKKKKMYCRFLKTPGEIIHEKSSKLEQLENEDNEDLKEDPLEVSP